MIRHFLQQLWRTPSTLYALVLAWFLLYGFTFFWGKFLLQNQASFDTFFTFHPWVYLFLAPALTLFGWPEERKNGTLNRYVNLSPSPLKLVCAQFIARSTALLVFLVGTLPFAAMVWWLGTPEWALFLSGTLASFVLALILLALATLMSAATSRALVAFVLGVIASAALLYILPNITTPLGNMGWSLLTSYRLAVTGQFTLLGGALALLLLGASLVFAARLLAKTLHKGQHTLTCASILLTIALFFIQLLPPLYLDATPSQRHTLHPQSRAFVAQIETPITLTLYTPKAAHKLPPLWQNHATQTTHFLQRLARLNDAITLTIIHPELTPLGEFAAREANMQPITISGAMPLFHGLQLTSDVGQATLPLISPERAHLLEFDLMGALLKASRAVAPQIGLLTEMNLDPATSTKRPRFLEALISTYGVKKVSAYEPEIPAEIDLLIVLQTPTMSIESVYALDQYLVNGGKALVLLDPFFRTAPSDDLRAADRNADAKEQDHPADILRPLGIDYSYRFIAADNSVAMPVELDDVGRTRYPLWLDLGLAHFNQTHPMLTNINRLALIESGLFTLTKAPENITVTPLISTSRQGQYVVREDLMTLSPQGIASNLRGTPQSHSLAVEITGNIQSLWPEIPAGVKQYYTDYALDAANVDFPAHRKTSQNEATLIAIADLDFLSDDYTLATQNGAAPSAQNPLMNNNLMFIFNVVQTLLDEDVLVPLRNRAPSTKPFHKLDNQLTVAAGIFQQKEAAIGEQLLNNAADKKTLLDQISDAAMTQNQAEELQALSVREVALQRQLRGVQYNMQSLTRRIGHTLMALVFFLPPLLAVLLWFCYTGLINRRRSHTPKHL